MEQSSLDFQDGQKTSKQFDYDSSDDEILTKDLGEVNKSSEILCAGEKTEYGPSLTGGSGILVSTNQASEDCSCRADKPDAAEVISGAVDADEERVSNVVIVNGVTENHGANHPECGEDHPTGFEQSAEQENTLHMKAEMINLSVFTDETTDVAVPDYENELLESETLSDCSVPEDPERESFVICFPEGESFDLREKSSHTTVIHMTSSLLNQLDEVKESLSIKEEEVLKNTKAISGLKDHVKEISEKYKTLDGRFHAVAEDLEKTRGLLKSHDASARASISRLQKENGEQVKALKARCSAMQKEKEVAVMNYARREKELLDAKRVSELADKKAKEAIREKDKAITQMKGLKMDVAKVKSALEKKDAETAQLKQDAEKWKEEANSHVFKVKWAQNKLKSETELHNETKEKLSKAVAEIKRAKEEAEQIRRNCQGMIKTYQESEEMRSNSLDSQLKEKEMLLSQQKAKSGELEGIHKQQMDELRKLKQKHKDALEENTVMKTRVECLEKERIKNEETLKGYSELLNKQKREAASTTEQLMELDEVKNELASRNERISELEETVCQEQESREQMKEREENWKIKEQELLEFTQKVSSKNAELTSESENLALRLENTLKQLTKSQTRSNEIEEELKSVKSKLDSQSHQATSTSAEMNKRLQDKETTVNHLTVELEEVKDEIRTIKRRNNANIKDLTRQLQQARKRLEPYESNAYPSASGPATEDGSMGSRASSDTSLDCVGRGNGVNNGSLLSHNSAAESGSFCNNSVNGSLEVPETMVTTTGEISTQALIERIVRLQRVHARKNEKIDFLQDHVRQLVDEIQKKNKVIQHYMLREESGMLMPESVLSHGVTTDQGNKMPRHLSMEINRKMQSVLEDTLLKNIALKESIDALGKEIARLSTTPNS